LAESTGNYEKAAEAFARIKKAAEGAATPVEEKPQWQKAGSLPALMKQVPVVNNSLRRGVEGRFQRQAEQLAGQAATLAAIAQVSQFDLSAVKDPADAAKWRQLCNEMRDAAGEVNSAAHAQDQAKAKAALARMMKSCDACHATFRKEN